MATMISEVYDALREAGASEDKARRAAEVLSNYDERFNRLERQIADTKTGLERQIADTKTGLEHQITDVRSDIKVLKWQIGALFALFAALVGPMLWLALRTAAKVGALPG